MKIVGINGVWSRDQQVYMERIVFYETAGGLHLPCLFHFLILCRRSYAINKMCLSFPKLISLLLQVYGDVEEKK